MAGCALQGRHVHPEHSFFPARLLSCLSACLPNEVAHRLAASAGRLPARSPATRPRRAKKDSFPVLHSLYLNYLNLSGPVPKGPW